MSPEQLLKVCLISRMPLMFPIPAMPAYDWCP